MAEKLKLNFWVRVKIKELIRLEQRCSGKRKGFYKYLAAILNFCGDQDRKGTLDATCRQLTERPGQKGRSKDPLRIVLDATSTADLKTRSRMGRALRYVFNHQKNWRPREMLARFLREHGGIAGCARKIAVRRERNNYDNDYDDYYD
jgi:hypothetical protein